MVKYSCLVNYQKVHFLTNHFIKGEYMKICDIIERAINGDADAFATLYNKTNDKNYIIAQYYMKNEQDSFDVLQDSYIKIYQNLSQFRGENWESFFAWTSRIIRNTAMNHLKKQRVIVFSDLQGNATDGEEYEYDVVDESGKSQPDIVLEKKEAEETVKILLSGLSEEQRICVLMYYMEQMSTTEIANEIGCSVNTVKSRLGYARKHIQKQEPLLKKRGLLVSGMGAVVLLACAFRSEMASAHLKPLQIKKSNQILQEVLRQNNLNKNKFAYRGTKTIFIKKCIAGIIVASIAVSTTAVFYHSIKTNLRSKGNIQQPSKPSVMSINVNPSATPIEKSQDVVEREEKKEQTKAKSTAERILHPKATKKSKKTPQPKVKPTSKPMVTKKPKIKTTPRPQTTKKPKPTKSPEKTDDTAEWDEDYTDWE